MSLLKKNPGQLLEPEALVLSKVGTPLPLAVLLHLVGASMTGIKGGLVARGKRNGRMTQLETNKMISCLPLLFGFASVWKLATILAIPAAIYERNFVFYVSRLCLFH
jgi:hypothetical protein